MLLLLEDDLPLAAPHTAHDEIRRLGRGRYSHWGRCIYFSTSDNTDPRITAGSTNWRSECEGGHWRLTDYRARSFRRASGPY